MFLKAVVVLQIIRLYLGIRIIALVSILIAELIALTMLKKQRIDIAQVGFY